MLAITEKNAMWKFEQWKQLLDGGDEMLQRMYTEGEAILRAHDQNVQSVVKGSARNCAIRQPTQTSLYNQDADRQWFSRQVDHLEHQSQFFADGLAANCPPHLQSDVGHELANQSGTFGLLWHIDKGNVCRCSLRSNGDYDVSAIAKAFGGGGHRNAAGFMTDIQTLLGWIK